MELSKKIEKWEVKNGKVYENELEFFGWLQGCEYPGSEVEYNGQSGSVYGKRSFTLIFEDGETEDFIVD